MFHFVQARIVLSWLLSQHFVALIISLYSTEYLCAGLIQSQDNSVSCKENEDPSSKPSKQQTSTPPPVQKLPSEKKDIKKTNQEEDFFEGDDDDDDVFQQYMPQDVDSNTMSAQTSGVKGNQEQVKCMCKHNF